MKTIRVYRVLVVYSFMIIVILLSNHCYDTIQHNRHEKIRMNTICLNAYVNEYMSDNRLTDGVFTFGDYPDGRLDIIRHMFYGGESSWQVYGYTLHLGGLDGCILDGAFKGVDPSALYTQD